MFYEKQLHPRDTYQGIVFDEHEKARLLHVLKRGANTLSPPDMKIVKLIEEMEK